jgi:hypothetical protein
MKFAGLAAACAAATFLWSPVAQAQASVACADLQNATELALDDFVSIQGRERDKANSIFESTLKLAGATDCALTFDWDSVLYCWWRHDTEATAQSAYAALDATACLSDWEPGSSRDADVPETAREHKVFLMDVTDEDALGVLVHWGPAEKPGGGMAYEVWYELTYYLF